LYGARYTSQICVYADQKTVIMITDPVAAAAAAGSMYLPLICWLPAAIVALQCPESSGSVFDECARVMNF